VVAFFLDTPPLHMTLLVPPPPRRSVFLTIAPLESSKTLFLLGSPVYLFYLAGNSLWKTGLSAAPLSDGSPFQRLSTMRKVPLPKEDVVSLLFFEIFLFG